MLARSLLVAVVASSRAVRRFSCSEVINKSRMPVDSDGRMSVRCVPGESKMTLSFVFEGKRKQLLRNQEEPLGCALRRITQSAIAILEGGKKKKKNSKKKKSTSTSQEMETDVVGGAAAVARTSGMNKPALSGCDVKDDAGAECETVKVHLSFAGEAMDPELMNSEAWREGATLEIGSNCYQVERNPPSIISLSLPSVIMFGFPVFPVAHFEFVDRAHILYEWFVDADEVKAVEHEERTWQLVGNAEFFTPSVQHVGHKLRFRVTPGDGTRLGESQEKETTAVEASPGRCTFDSRHRFTTDKTALGTLRVISYNILADTYAQTELARTVLFPYCPPYAMDLGYRQQLLQKELKGYNGDIICLQEVDNRVFERLTPVLQRLGFEGKYCEKENQHEGLALFYQTSRLRLIDQHDVVYAEALKNESRHTPFLEYLSTHPQLLSLICDLSTVLQVCVFQSVEDESQKLCVANTHLYWHPQSAAVRLVQVVLALHHLEHVTSTMHPSTPVVFCGDFNSTPDTGLYDFITSGTFSACHDDWRKLEGENDVPAGFGIEVGHNLGMYSACGEPEYTNFVQSFNGCLDYVFASRDALQIVQILPMPSHEEITAHIALPSITHPSDHIALVCDLKFSPRDDK